MSDQIYIGQEGVPQSSTTLVVQDLAALKALVVFPGAVTVEYGQAAGLWTWAAGSTETADDGVVVEPDNGASGRWLRVWTGLIDPRWYGAVVNGVIDDSAAFTAASAAAEIHSTSVLIPGNMAIGSAYTFRSNVMLVGDGDSALTWLGAATPMLTSSDTTILYRSGIRGVTLHSATATPVIDLKSPWQCVVKDVFLSGNSATAIGLSITTNAAGDTNPDGNRNAVFNYVENLLQDGTVGTFVYLSGRGSGTTPLSVVTLNTFHHLNATDVRVRGYDFAEWVDSNYFSGMHRVQMNANNSIGVEFNTAAPTANRGVYANNFDHLAVDTFGTMTGRVGVKMNFTKFNKLGMYFNDPEAEGGAFVIDPTNTLSVDVVHQKAGTNDLYSYRKQYYEKGAEQILTASSPYSIRQTWSNGAIPFSSFEIDNTDTGSTGGSTFASWKISGSAKFNFFKDGTSIQSGGADIGYGLGTAATSLGIGRARTGDGASYIDLVGDTTYTSGGLRITRSAGANGASTFQHRGTGVLQLVASEAATIQALINGTTRLSLTSTAATISAPTTIAHGTQTVSAPTQITQTWNDGAVPFVGFQVSVTDAASSPSSILSRCLVGGAARHSIFRDGSSIQSGSLDAGYAVATTSVSVGIGRARTGDGNVNLDLIGDTTYTAGGFKIVRFGGSGGANGATSMTHRGTGDFLLVAQEAAAIKMQVNGSTRFAVDNTGLAFFGVATVAQPTVTGSRGGNAALDSLLTALASQGLVVNSTTA